MEKDTSVADRLARMKVKSVSFLSLLSAFLLSFLLSFDLVGPLLENINPKTLENHRPPQIPILLYSFKPRSFH